MKATATPWRLGEDATGHKLTIWGAKVGICVTSVFDDRMGDDAPTMTEAEGNAALIVRAVNEHDDLITALRAICQECNGPAELLAAIDKGDRLLRKIAAAEA